MNGSPGQGQASIRSYANRGGHLSHGKRRSLQRLLPLHGLPPRSMPAWHEIFPACSELHVEIGFGSGEAALDFAGKTPDSGLVAFDVYPVGVASLLSGIDATGLTNLKVVWADALPLLPYWFHAGELSSIRVFYPDPWPKRRHNKRRLVNQAFLDLSASLLQPGGVLHFATDWLDYHKAVLSLLQADAGWEIIAMGSNAKAGRPVTRFERRALREGRESWDCRCSPVRLQPG